MKGEPGAHYFIADEAGAVVYRARKWRKVWRWLRMQRAV